MQGACTVRAAHWRLWKRPAVSTSTASPGATSRSRRKPSTSTATDSEATSHSVPASQSLRPMTSGRMP